MNGTRRYIPQEKSKPRCSAHEPVGARPSHTHTHTHRAAAVTVRMRWEGMQGRGLSAAGVVVELALARVEMLGLEVGDVAVPLPLGGTLVAHLDLGKRQTLGPLRERDVLQALAGIHGDRACPLQGGRAGGHPAGGAQPVLRKGGLIRRAATFAAQAGTVHVGNVGHALQLGLRPHIALGAVHGANQRLQLAPLAELLRNFLGHRAQLEILLVAELLLGLLEELLFFLLLQLAELRLDVRVDPVQNVVAIYNLRDGVVLPRRVLQVPRGAEVEILQGGGVVNVQRHLHVLPLLLRPLPGLRRVHPALRTSPQHGLRDECRTHRIIPSGWSGHVHPILNVLIGLVLHLCVEAEVEEHFTSLCFDFTHALVALAAHLNHLRSGGLRGGEDVLPVLLAEVGQPVQIGLVDDDQQGLVPKKRLDVLEQ
eukprot:RCo017403